MNSSQQHALSKLLRAWTNRETVRTQPANFAAMVEARRELDDARLEMARERNR